MCGAARGIGGPARPRRGRPGATGGRSDRSRVGARSGSGVPGRPVRPGTDAGDRRGVEKERGDVDNEAREVLIASHPSAAEQGPAISPLHERTSERSS